MRRTARGAPRRTLANSGLQVFPRVLVQLDVRIRGKLISCCRVHRGSAETGRGGLLGGVGLRRRSLSQSPGTGDNWGLPQGLSALRCALAPDIAPPIGRLPPTEGPALREVWVAPSERVVALLRVSAVLRYCWLPSGPAAPRRVNGQLRSALTLPYTHLFARAGRFFRCLALVEHTSAAGEQPRCCNGRWSRTSSRNSAPRLHLRCIPSHTRVIRAPAVQRQKWDRENREST